MFNQFHPSPGLSHEGQFTNPVPPQYFDITNPAEFTRVLRMGEMGIVTTLFKHPENDQPEIILGGLIRLNTSRKPCFFLASSCTESFQLNDFVKVDFHVIEEIVSENRYMGVECIAVHVSGYDEWNTQSLSSMMSITAMSLENICIINSSCALVWNSFGIIPIEIASARRMENVATFAHLDAILSPDCGVMMFRIAWKRELVACYFELKDINASCMEEVIALTQFLENFGCVVLCHLTTTKEPKIPYILEKFIILVTLPFNLMHLKERGQNQLKLPLKRYLRFKWAVMSYKQGKVLWKRQEIEKRALSPLPNPQLTGASFGNKEPKKPNLARTEQPLQSYESTSGVFVTPVRPKKNPPIDIPALKSLPDPQVPEVQVINTNFGNSGPKEANIAQTEQPSQSFESTSGVFLTPRSPQHSPTKDIPAISASTNPQPPELPVIDTNFGNSEPKEANPAPTAQPLQSFLSPQSPQNSPPREIRDLMPLPLPIFPEVSPSNFDFMYERPFQVNAEQDAPPFMPCDEFEQGPSHQITPFNNPPGPPFAPQKGMPKKRMSFGHPFTPLKNSELMVYDGIEDFRPYIVKYLNIKNLTERDLITRFNHVDWVSRIERMTPLKEKILNLLTRLMERARRCRGEKKWRRTRNRLMQQLNHLGCFDFICKCAKKNPNRLKKMDPNASQLPPGKKPRQKVPWIRCSHIINLHQIANALFPEQSVMLNNFLASDYFRAKETVFSTSARKRLNFEAIEIEIEQNQECARHAKKKLIKFIESLIVRELNPPEPKAPQPKPQQIPSGQGEEKKDQSPETVQPLPKP